MSYSPGAMFREIGGRVIDPVSVLPSALPLDLCGESVRARLCLFTDHRNRDMALRPDLTLPVALEEVSARKAGHVTGERIYQYAARAFRQPVMEREPLEFLQVGFERFGAEAGPEIDAQTYALVSSEAEAAGVQAGVARFGDLAIVPAFIDAMGFSPAVNSALRRAFRQAGGLAAYLERGGNKRHPIVEKLAGLGAEEAENAVEGALQAENLRHHGNRSMDEIVTRLMEQSADHTDGDVPEEARRILEALLEVECAPEAASDRLRAIAESAGLSTLDSMLEAISVRMGKIAEASPQFLGNARFGVSFGRRFTYYDGFVFEIAKDEESASRPFGAGGRYDHLLSDLSQGTVSATAIGGVVRPDRLALAAGRGEA